MLAAKTGRRGLERAVADQDDGIGPGEATGDRFAQRPGRNASAITETLAGVDDQQGDVFDQGGVLKAVVHQHQSGAGIRRRDGAGDPVAGDDGRQVAREQQRLVAHIRNAVARAIDPQRPAPLAGIAAGEDVRMHLLQQGRQRQHCRRFAGAAGNQIADADDRNIDPPWPAELVPQPTAGGEQPTCRRQTGRGEIASARGPLLPELRCAHAEQPTGYWMLAHR